jgi:hypothetical protein
VRKLLGYRRYQGVAAAQALAKLYGVARLFVNFFQPSFKLTEKHRQGAHVTKRYDAPQTPCQRVLEAESTPETVKQRLRETAESLDPLKLLEEIRALQSHLVAISDNVPSSTAMPAEVDMVTFMSGLSDAWRDGEVRPTHRSEASARYQRVIKVTPPSPRKKPDALVLSAAIDPQELKRSAAELGWPAHDPEVERKCALRQKEYARRHIQRQHAFTLVWPLVCRRLEGCPNMSARGLFDELRAMYPGRWHQGQLAAFTQRVSQWRRDAQARGIEVGPIKHRRSLIPRGRRRPDPFAEHWSEILSLIDEDPDQTARELIDAVMTRFPYKYTTAHLRTLQRRLKVWRRDSVQRLILELEGEAYMAAVDTAGNVSR